MLHQLLESFIMKFIHLKEGVGNQIFYSSFAICQELTFEIKGAFGRANLYGGYYKVTGKQSPAYLCQTLWYATKKLTMGGSPSLLVPIFLPLLEKWTVLLLMLNANSLTFCIHIYLKVERLITLLLADCKLISIEVLV